MKVVFTGKGGAGKTTIAASTARLLARAGMRVVAINADPNPNLGIALGLGCEETARLDSAVNALLRENAASGEVDRMGHPRAEPPAADVVRDLGASAPDGVRLVQTGRIERPADGCLCCGSHLATRRLFHTIDDGDGVLVADLEPGVNDLLWVEPSPTDVVVVVTEPYRKSLEVALRTIEVARGLGVEQVLVVANRVESPEDVERIRQWLRPVELVEVPEDRAVSEAAAHGTSVVDATPDCPALCALRPLVSRLSRRVIVITGPATRAADSRTRGDQVIRRSATAGPLARPTVPTAAQHAPAGEGETRRPRT